MVVPSKKAWIALAFALALTAVVLPRSSRIILPGPDAGFYPIPKVSVHPFRTNFGLTLYVPDHGDQCWDVHLLCAPYPDANLRLRAVNRLEKGFAIVQ